MGNIEKIGLGLGIIGNWEGKRNEAKVARA